MDRQEQWRNHRRDARRGALILVIIGGAVMAGVGRGPGARAQTSPPPATAVPTATAPPLPSARTLITAMFRVMHRVRAVRVTYTGSYQDVGEQGSVQGTEELGVKARVIKVTAVESVAGSKPSQQPLSDVFEQVLKDRYDAIRRDYQYWDCWHLGKGLVVDYAPVDAVHHPYNAANLGAVTVDGIAAWHITALKLSYTSDGTAVSIPLEYYINQHNHRLVRQVERHVVSEIYAPGRLATFTLTLDYAHYGESVSATLPSTCHAHK